ncbi:putative damage response protein DAP1 [Coleophoma crateriformis]|uniref:Putative damage response protein DAP1 n=1 Tax=Coleophoma crateriformis TaxID=565419 RepID=A0A3D8T116_9HELO|nr:putative damage response protein DAP1 [Coleophoma crateriformis]
MSGKFEPKVPVVLNPPKNDPISPEYLAKCNGTDGNPCYVAIKGKVFDVGDKDAYRVVFAGHDASRALGMTSTKAEDVRPDWYDLEEKEKGVLNDWFTFFSKRYNIVGEVEGAKNL